MDRLIIMESLLILLVLLPSPHLLARIVSASPVASTTDSKVPSSGRETSTVSSTKRTNGGLQTSTIPWTRSENGSYLGLPIVPRKTNATFVNAIEAFLVESDPAEGSSVTLSCVVFDPSILTVSWYKGVERLSTHDTLAPAADAKRMTVSYGVKNSTQRVFNLSIDFLHNDDSGGYRCRALHRPDTGVTVELNVQYVPELHYPECSLNGQRQAVVTEGEELRFECHSKGSMPPWLLIWVRQLDKSISVIQSPLEDQGGIIVSSHSMVASLDHNGATFTCSVVCLLPECMEVQNRGLRNCSIGPLEVRSPTPTESPPLISIDTGFQIATEGDDVEMSCSTSLVDGNAAWFPVGEDPVDDHIQISDDGSHMSIRNVKENDTDLMACGVFCNSSLVTVKQVHLEVLRKDPHTTPHAERTTVGEGEGEGETTNRTLLASTTEQTETSTEDKSENLSHRDRGTHKQSLIIGAPTVIICLLIVIILLIVVFKFRRRTYQQAATSEVPDTQLSV